LIWPSKAAGSFHREPSRLASRPGACFREGKNQSFAMPVSIANFGRFGNRRIFFKKPLASGRVFDIFFAPFRPKDKTDSMIADR
jgi:hypothetical protein